MNIQAHSSISVIILQRNPGFVPRLGSVQFRFTILLPVFSKYSTLASVHYEIKSFSRNAFFLFVLCLLVNGCASFPGKELPAYTYADLPPAYGEKTCLVISDNLSKEDSEITKETFAMLEKSGYFLTTPERCASPSNGGISHNSITFNVKNDLRAVNLAVAFISGFISGSTLTIIPAYGRDDFVLTVQLKMNGELVKEYVYRDHIDTWIHLSMLFIVSDHKPRDVIRRIYERMIMNFLYDYSRDGQQRRFYAIRE